MAHVATSNFNLNLNLQSKITYPTNSIETKLRDSKKCPMTKQQNVEVMAITQWQPNDK